MAIDKLPALNAKYTDPNISVGEGGDKKAALATGATIQAFYSGQLGADFKKVQSNAAAGKSNVQDEAKLASDIATLQNLERKFAAETKDLNTLAALSKDPSMTTEKIGDQTATTNDFLAAAGATNKSDKDFMYTKEDKYDGQSVNVQMAKSSADNPTAQGTSGFGSVNGQFFATSSSTGTGGKDWAFSDGSGKTSVGGIWDADSAKDLVAKLGAGSGTANYGVREKTEAFAQMTESKKSMSEADFNGLLKQPGAQQLWDFGQKSKPPSDLTTNPQSYNALFNHFNQ